MKTGFSPASAAFGQMKKRIDIKVSPTHVFSLELEQSSGPKEIAIQIHNLAMALGYRSYVLGGFLTTHEHQEIKRYLSELNYEQLSRRLVEAHAEESLRSFREVALDGVTPSKDGLMGLGIHLHQDWIESVVLDAKLNLVSKRLDPLPEIHSAYELVDKIEEIVGNLKLAYEEFELSTIAVSISGKVTRTGIVSPNELFSESLSLRYLLEKCFGVPTLVELDANVSAMVERNQGRSDFALVHIGEEISAAIVQGGKLVQGVASLGGELGHMIVDQSEHALICEDGNPGSLKTLVTKKAICSAYQDISDAELSLSEISRRYEEGEENARIVFQRVAEVMTEVIALFSQVLQIQEVVIAGTGVQEYGSLEELILEQLPEEVKKTVSFQKSQRFDFAVAAASHSLKRGAFSFERIPINTFLHNEKMMDFIANEVRNLINTQSKVVLGVPTGKTSINLYRKLVEFYQSGKIESFRKVTLYTLYEYFPIEESNPASCRAFLNEVFLQHVDILPENVHIPHGTDIVDVPQFCQSYEDDIERDGVDLMLLTIGGGYIENKKLIGGHIALNEANFDWQSITHLEKLAENTRATISSNFRTLEEIPRHAVTVGVGTILKAKRIFLLADGEDKALIIKEAVEYPPSFDVTASCLQIHPNARTLISSGAANRLTRTIAPWRIRDILWQKEIQKFEEGKESLVPCFLIKTTLEKKVPLKDLEKDHVSEYFDEIQEKFQELKPKTLDWIQGKIHGESEVLPQGKKILLFSPRPDDVLFSMGATLEKIVKNGNEVTIVAMTTGSMGVMEKHVGSYLKKLEKKQLLKKFEKGQLPREELFHWKAKLREQEILNAIQDLGVHVEFLQMPFYETTYIGKAELGEADYQLVQGAIERVQPEIIFLPGEMTDPNGTNQRCTDAVRHVLKTGKKSKAKDLFFYKGPWGDDFLLYHANCMVCFDAEEMERKMSRIRLCDSQMEPNFPGLDPKPFWERILDKNTYLGGVLNEMGFSSHGKYCEFLLRVPVKDYLQNFSISPEFLYW